MAKQIGPVPMRRPLLAWTVLLAVLPALLGTAPQSGAPKPDPKDLSALPTYARRVAPAMVGLRVEVPPDRPSAITLGVDRGGSGVIFDQGGYVLTVSYLVLDAARIEVQLRDGRKVTGKLHALDLESGLGVVRLEGAGPWPAATLGDSSKVAAGDVTGTIGIDEEGDLVIGQGRIQAIRPFSASWEYMLDRAFLVAPHNPAFGGAALVDQTGAVIGITSLRLGQSPIVNLAIPIEKFLAGKDELLAKGRVESRPPRPWLGLYTQERAGGGVVVAGVSPAGPARSAGFRQGDIIVRINGEQISTQEEFYRRLWSGGIGQEVQLVVLRAQRLEAITVRPVDRYRIYRTSDR
jgi:S1-C subfamily serine protease